MPDERLISGGPSAQPRRDDDVEESYEPFTPHRDESFGPGPIPELRRSQLLSEDISQKTGNYVFTFGFPGSGKTTFHAFLVRYLMQHGPFKTEPMNARGGGRVDYDVNRMVTNWMTEWQEGRFPSSTPVGEEQIRELGFEVQPLQGVRTPLDFSFLEVSGEMLQTVMPTETQDPIMSRVLRELLENTNIKLVILLLINPSVHNNDALFLNFMNYLDQNLGFDIRERASLGIIVSKPEEALRELKRLRQGYEAVADLRGEVCEDFVEEFAPHAYRIWFDWPNPSKKIIGRLYLGDIEMRGQEPRLVRPDFQSVEKIFSWLYTQFTGEKLGPTRWQRFLKWFKT